MLFQAFVENIGISRIGFTGQFRVANHHGPKVHDSVLPFLCRSEMFVDAIHLVFGGVLILPVQDLICQF